MITQIWSLLSDQVAKQLVILWHYYSSGYREFKGQVLTSDDLQELIAGLRTNDLLQYSHVLTG